MNRDNYVTRVLRVLRVYSPFGDIKLLIPRRVTKDNVKHALNDDKFRDYVYTHSYAQSGSAASTAIEISTIDNCFL